MFKEESRTWLYLIGVLIMFGILLVMGRSLFLPFLYGNGNNPFNDQSNNTPEPAFTIDTNLDYYAKLTTSFGEIVIDLYETSTPQNVNNFVYLSNSGYYNETKFHRLIKNFLVQGGDRNTLNTDPNDDGKGFPGYTIDDEINWDSLDLSEDKRKDLQKDGFQNTPGLESKPLERYSVAMANDGPNTNGSQFFIVLAEFNDPRLSELTGKFTVIGKVISGFDVLQTINGIEVDNEKSQVPRPKQDIIIQKAETFTR